MVRENQQGELAVVYRGRRLAFKEIFVRPAPAAAPADTVHRLDTRRRQTPGGTVSRPGRGPHHSIHGSSPSNRKPQRSSEQLPNFHQEDISIGSKTGTFLMCYDTSQTVA